MSATGSLPECRLLARIAQKLTGRCWHHKPNGRKLPSLKKICRSAYDPEPEVGLKETLSRNRPIS